MSVFERLNAVNVNGHTETKNNLTYLSWAWAWGTLKKLYPNSSYTIYENPQGWNYFTDGRTCWVKTGVTVVSDIEETQQELIEYLPVMDYKNNSIPADKVTSFDVNKAIQRSLTKAIARHGLGLYIYAGEDLPEDEAAIAANARGENGTRRDATVETTTATVADAKKETRKLDRAEQYTKCQAYLGLGNADMAIRFKAERDAMGYPTEMTDRQFIDLIKRLAAKKE